MGLFTVDFIRRDSHDGCRHTREPRRRCLSNGEYLIHFTFAKRSIFCVVGHLTFDQVHCLRFSQAK